MVDLNMTSELYNTIIIMKYLSCLKIGSKIFIKSDFQYLEAYVYSSIEVKGNPLKLNWCCPMGSKAVNRML